MIAAPALAVDKWYVEFSEDGFDESVVRRAVGLELREVEIPGDPFREGDGSADVSLHIRVERSGDSLLVNLWDRGEFVGRRRVSLGSHPRILARRVGLAVGELGRQLSARRSRQVQRLEREAFLQAEREKERERLARLQDLGLRAEGRFLGIFEGGYLAGPALGLELNDHFPVRLTGGITWMAGALPPLSDEALGSRSPTWSSFDVWLGTDYVFALEGPNWWTLGVEVAGSAVHVNGSSQVDEIPEQRDTYSLRAGGRLGYAYGLGPGLRLRAEGVVGSLLRPIPIRHGDDRLDLGGPFVAFNLGVTLAPSGS